MNPSQNYTERLIQLFEQEFDVKVAQVNNIPPSGSDRRYVRLIGENGTSVIGAYSPNRKENSTFFYFASMFNKHKLAVPQVIKEGSEKECYLLEDLGDISLLDVLEQEGYTDKVKQYFKKAIEDLVKFQWIGGREVDFTMCHAASTFDAKVIQSDLNYFKYYFVDVLNVEYDKVAFQEEIVEWSKLLASEQPRTFMYRDFQSRNILIKDGALGYIDFQGGMEGLPHYDLVSLLWQAKAKLPMEWKKELLNHYVTTINNTREISNFDEMHFRRIYLEIVLLRILQTLGAYGLRGLIERKPHFISSIYPALQQLKGYLEAYPHLARFTELSKVLNQLVSPKIMDQFNKPTFTEGHPLKVSIFSFSYKKGLPVDESGHGGGFVFDCRGILNPGRYEPYKALTGRDAPVQDFLLTQTKMPGFLNNVFQTIDYSIENYLERNFDYLSIGFGCTGGQHRSVFAAEQTKKHLKQVYNIEASIIHLEQDPNDIQRRK